MLAEGYEVTAAHQATHWWFTRIPVVGRVSAVPTNPGAGEPTATAPGAGDPVLTKTRLRAVLAALWV